MKNKIFTGLTALLLASPFIAQAQVTTIAAWNFDAIGARAANYDSPSATTGTGTATVLGMNNNYNNTFATNFCDILVSAGSSSGTNGWRLRGSPGNGWSSQAPLGSQGAQFNTSTIGYNNITVSFDINTTAQAEGKVALLYTLDGTTWQTGTPTSSGSIAGSAILNNNSSANTVSGFYVKMGTTAGWNNQIVAAIPGAGQNANFGIRIVNASTGADCVNITGAALNNSSGNLRFGNIIISGTAGGGNLNTPPTIIASTNATVNGPFTNTFVDDSAWRVFVGGIKVNNVDLTNTAYTISAGKIFYNPAASPLLLAGGTVTLSISATNYNPATVVQVIGLNTPPALTPDASATVDGPFTNTFADNATWRAAITGIKVNNADLLPSAYTVSAGKIIFFPAVTNLLQTSGVKLISISALKYSVDLVTNNLSAGAVTSLSITSQPGAPTANGGTLVTNPVLRVVDQYGNLPTTTASAIFTATTAGGAWSFGSGSSVAQVLTNGIAVFTNLSATSASAVPNAFITFTASAATGLGTLPSTVTNSATFSLPAPRTSGFTAGNLAVFQLDLVTKNSTFSILELNPSTTNQVDPVNIYAVSATGTNGLRNASASTTGRLATSDDGTLVCFTGFLDDSSATSDETAINPRGVGTFDAQGNFVLRTTYIGIGGATGNQTRSCSSVDNTNWFIGDKGGVYLNDGVTPYIAGAGNNVRSVKCFGGTPYALQQSSASVINTPISIINGQVLYPLAGFAQDTRVVDFYMIRSGALGTNFDTVYYMSGTNSTSGAIFKYYATTNYDQQTGQQLWAFAGSDQTLTTGDGLCAATNSTGGVDLYYTTGNGGVASNSVVKVHDSAADNTTISLTGFQTLYTAPARSTLKGIAFAPAANGSVAVTPSLPINITPGSMHLVGSGAAAAAQFSFTNVTGLSFSIRATNNLSAPKAAWPVIGTATENPAGTGNYQFTDPSPATNSSRYYILSQP
jgi:hypothetical protein